MKHLCKVWSLCHQ